MCGTRGSRCCERKNETALYDLTSTPSPSGRALLSNQNLTPRLISQMTTRGLTHRAETDPPLLRAIIKGEKASTRELPHPALADGSDEIWGARCPGQCVMAPGRLDGQAAHADSYESAIPPTSFSHFFTPTTRNQQRATSHPIHPHQHKLLDTMPAKRILDSPSSSNDKTPESSPEQKKPRGVVSILPLSHYSLPETR